jgi:hypothetical protein
MNAYLDSTSDEESEMPILNNENNKYYHQDQAKDQIILMNCNSKDHILSRSMSVTVDNRNEKLDYLKPSNSTSNLFSINNNNNNNNDNNQFDLTRTQSNNDINNNNILNSRSISMIMLIHDQNQQRELHLNHLHHQQMCTQQRRNSGLLPFSNDNNKCIFNCNIRNRRCDTCHEEEEDEGKKDEENSTLFKDNNTKQVKQLLFSNFIKTIFKTLKILDCIFIIFAVK